MTADSLMLGVNFTTPTNLEKIQSLHSENRIGFVEILIDNFLTCDPISIRKAFGEIPLAFHIMKSRFLEVDYATLKQIGRILKNLINELKPIYISDHIAKFNCDGLPMPVLAEVDYTGNDHIAKKVSDWQEILGVQIFFENFPSAFPSEIPQPVFFEKLVRDCDCGLLFDLSNAIIAQNNANVAIEAWSGILSQTNHFHVGGYSPSTMNQNLWLDTHNCELSPASKSAVTQWVLNSGKPSQKTLVIEYDHSIDFTKWKKDLDWARNASQVLRGAE